MQSDSSDINHSDFQPGSGGMLCQKRDGVEYFISAEEILSYNSTNSPVMSPYLPNTRGVEFAHFSDYKPVVMIESYFKGQEKPSTGSGAFIGPTGILTCAHVLYSKELNAWANKVYVYTDYVSPTNYGKRYEVDAKYIGGEYVDNDLDDWGIITVTEKSRSGYYGFKSTTNNSELVGMNVTCVGYAPAEGYLSLLASKGVITKRIVTKALSGLIIEAEARPGMSGGPVLEDTYIRGFVIRAGTIEYGDGYIQEDIVSMLIINPWLYNAIYEHSGR